MLGAGRLGSATAETLAGKGAAVAVADINDGAVENVVETIRAKGGKANGFTVDITDEHSIEAAVRGSHAWAGALTGIYINAYEGPVARRDSDLVNIDLDDWRRSVEGTLTGTLIAMRHGIPLIVASGGGGVICTSSTDAYDSSPNRVAYPVTKWALHALVRHVAARWGKEGIRCNAIVPGLIPPRLPSGEFPPDRKEFYEGYIAKTPSHRGGEPADVANVVSFLLSDEGAWINGQCINVDGGLILR